jgi:serine/threonine-protein kinase
MGGPSNAPCIPNYEVKGILGRGAMGVVFRAREVSTNREVALKWLPAGSQHLDARFVREAQAAAAIRHPNLVTVFGAGRTATGRYLVMELVDGRPLSSALLRRQVGHGAVLQLLAKIARALHVVHQAGIIHRDVKPSNILLDAAGEPRLADFGVARIAERTSHLTEPGQPVGTVAYMAPEVVVSGGAAATPASDVFSLGCVLYEGLTGETPGLRARLRNKDATLEKPLPPQVPRGIHDLCRRMLALDAVERPSAREVAERLEAVTERSAARSPRTVALVAGAIASPAIGVALALAMRSPPPAEVASSAGVQGEGTVASSIGASSLARSDTPEPRRELGSTTAGDSSSRRTQEPKALALHTRGKTRIYKADWDGAIADLNEAIKLAPTLAIAWSDRGWARGRKGDIQGAFADFDEAIRLGAESVHPWRQRGRLQLELQNWAAAVADLNEAIRLDPMSFAAWQDRGMARRGLGDLSGAIQDLEHALELGPPSVVATSIRAELEKLRAATKK